MDLFSCLAHSDEDKFINIIIADAMLYNLLEYWRSRKARFVRHLLHCMRTYDGLANRRSSWDRILFLTQHTRLKFYLLDRFSKSSGLSNRKADPPGQTDSNFNNTIRRFPCILCQTFRCHSSPESLGSFLVSSSRLDRHVSSLFGCLDGF